MQKRYPHISSFSHMASLLFHVNGECAEKEKPKSVFSGLPISPGKALCGSFHSQIKAGH